ncbi:MAG: TRAP transporter substrate-binding protein [Alphaproteobacteria bacterium]|nr:TRAP transporter substrate-binding protein [Alphaproteobacteria bacterium]
MIKNDSRAPEQSAFIMTKLRKAATSGVFAVAMAWSTLNGGASAAEIKWDMANEYPPTNIHSEGDSFFSKRLTELTKGEIEITHHFGASLGYRSKDQFYAVADGAIPLADTYVGALSGIDPLFLLSSLPFLAGTPADAQALFDISKADYEKLFAANNQKLLFVSPWPPSGLWGKNPLDSKEALADLRMRTYDANGTITFQAAGASPVQLSFADVIPQLSTGGIDAVLNSAEGGVSGKYWEYLSNFTEINYSMPLNMVHINLDSYNALSDELKAAVDQAAADTQVHIWENIQNRRQKNYSTMRENGITITDTLSDDFKTLLVESADVARQKWLGDIGPRGAEILDVYLARK